MEKLKIKVYNVRFGDAIFISVPDEDDQGNAITRHILIDVGNVQKAEGGINTLFEPVIKDILAILDGSPLDLYIMTHEHMDHVQGLLWTAKNVYTEKDLADKLKVCHSWLPVSSDPEYYETHEDAVLKKKLASETYLRIHEFAKASGFSKNKHLDILLQNNNSYLPSNPLNLGAGKTSDCVTYIRKLAGNNTHYVYRSAGNPPDNKPLFDLAPTHPFRTAQFEIWAPEEDSSEYYRSFTPMTLGFAKNQNAEPVLTTSGPPPGVDASAYYNLITYRQGGLYDNLLAIDKAANNTSIVFCLKWKGWTLLFPGDAEERSWKEMNKENVLTPVDFLKISHHGSSNGTPDSGILLKLFPDHSPGTGDRSAAIATYKDVYTGIPDEGILEELKDLGCAIKSTLDVADGEAIEFEFSPRN